MPTLFSKQYAIPRDGLLMPAPVADTVSFETGEIGAHRIYFPSNARIERVRSSVTKALAATDAGTITVANAAGQTMATITIPLSSAINTNGDSGQIASNNLVTRGSYITITTAKTTPGGMATVTIEYSVMR